LNPTAQNLLQQSKPQLVGHPITQFWPDWPHDLLLDGQKAGRQMEWTLNSVPAQTFDLHVTPLYDGRNRLVSRIVVLHDIGEHKKIEAQLKSSLHEKEVLLKEIHHRVKNNLQIISSLLNLQASQAEEPLVLQALQEGQGRVRSMALIHEILYRSDDLAYIDFGTYLHELTTQLWQTYHVYAGQVALDIETDEVFLTMETAVPCGLILHELVSNALKYAFVDGRSGQITIRLQAKNNSIYELSISDNGIGFPSHLDHRQTTTLGLQLVNTLIEQLEGHLTVTRRSGASFTITFEDTTPKETS
jgi:two-component sensor histidine kinase